MSKYIPNDFPKFEKSEPSKDKKLNFRKNKKYKWLSPLFDFVCFCIIFYFSFGFKITQGVVVLMTPLKGISWMFLILSIKIYGLNKYEKGKKDSRDYLKKEIKKLKQKYNEK